MKTQTKKVFKVKCPACKKESEQILQATRGVLWHSFDFETGQWETEEHQEKEVIGYFCKECGNELPAEMQEKITEEIEKAYGS